MVVILANSDDPDDLITCQNFLEIARIILWISKRVFRYFLVAIAPLAAQLEVVDLLHSNDLLSCKTLFIALLRVFKDI